MYNIAIFASGNGTNAENIAQTFNEGDLLRVTLCITNRKNAGVIDRMKKFGIETVYIPTKEWDSDPERIVALLRENNIDLIVLAGFMHLVSPVIVEAYDHRILNIHPSLLPKFGGKGMYGHHVHEAVVAAGETHSGVTVHYVDEKFDNGDILMQESFPLAEGETAESLEERIHEVEYSIFPKAIVKALINLESATKNGGTTPPPLEEVSLTRAQQTDAAWAHELKIDYAPEAHSADSAATPPPATEVRTNMPQRHNSRLPEEPMPDNYLVWAVLSAVICCFIPGIVAIIYASKVSSYYYQGDIEKSRKASDRAQLWIIISFAVGILWQTLSFPMMLISEGFSMF